MEEYTAVAFCAVGAEKVVSNEVKKLSPPGVYTILESGFGKVRFRTNLAGLYRALFSLRAADRLLLEAGSFPAFNFDELFEGAASIPWENFIPRGMGLKVAKVRSRASQLKAETSIQAIVHKAAAQRLCNHYSIRRLPGQNDTDTKEAELRVFMEKDTAAILLDISGEPLFKRGYRPGGGIAPLRETTAAAMMLLSGWKRKFPLYDLFCGSGTIIIEAAMYAWNQAPGLGRDFALSNLAIANKRTEDTIRRELIEQIDYSRHINITGSDADEKAITLARTNLRRVLALPDTSIKLTKTSGQNSMNEGKLKGIELKCLSMKETAPLSTPGSVPEPGFIITNPPYGKRLGETEDAEERYAAMAGICTPFSGWKLALICNHKGFESFFGRKADSCRELKSGAIDTWLYQYDKL